MAGAIAGLAGAYLGYKGTSKVANATTAAADRAAALATQPRRTQYGSFVDPTGGLSQFVDPITGQLNLAPIQQQSSGLLGGGRFRSVNPPSVGMTFLDPSIRATRERSLANIPSYQSILRPQLDSALQGLGQTRGRLEDLYGQTNDNAFLDPLLQRLALARGELTRGLVDRGLGGSSFQASALGNFESAAAPGIAQARQQGIQARQNLLGQIAGTDTQGLAAASAGVADLQNLDNLYASVAGQNLQQELSALGLSQADIGGLLAAAQVSGQAGQLKSQAFGNLLGGVGDIFSTLKFPSGGTPYNPSAGQYGGIA